MAVTLCHYDGNHPTEVHVDTSLHGLGGTLVQDGKPVAYASKALTPTEQCYANIKRKVLAIVFGVECFHTYVNSWTFTILMDHKLLEQIQQKTLADAPVCLQQVLMHLQGYDCTISYCPGKKMLLADTLSRYALIAAEEIALDTCFRPHQPHALLKPTSPPTQPWQCLGTNLFEFDKHEYLVVANYYSHMPIVWKVPCGQCISSKVIALLKEISEHGSPETLVSDNGPQYALTAFAEFVDEWKFTHMTSSLNHPKGNGFAESTVKIVRDPAICQVQWL